MLSLAYKKGDTATPQGQKMLLRIKVSRTEFQAACSDGWVDGQLQGRQGLYVYAELGQEQEYITRPNDDPKTSYRIFQGCAAYFARSQEQLDNGNYESENLANATVIIYC